MMFISMVDRSLRTLPLYVAFGVICFASASEDGCMEEIPFGQHNDPFLGRVVATRAKICGEVAEGLSSKYRADNVERLKTVVEELRPTYESLPKTERGYLGDASTRYLLHRHFLRTRAWRVKGLAPDGGSWSAHSVLDLLDNSTSSTRDLLQQRLQSRGLDLQEVALLGAVIENHVHQDAVKRLRKAWHAQQLPTITPVAIKDLELVLDTFMMSYIISATKALEPQNVARALRDVVKVYPKWPGTRSFVRAALRRTVGHSRRELTFTDAEYAVVEISETYGKFQYGECHDIKLDLLALEGPRSGRVSIHDFFGEALYADKYQFGESIAYMRRAGILDESDARHPSLVIPNYLDSPSQFVAVSDTFAVTCMDECEQLMVDLESQIAAPYATSRRIADAVAAMSSDTQPARKDGLPPRLLLRLEEIAKQDSGRDGMRLIPLHGRLFAQWLHHAFPRECPFPYVANGSVELLLPSEFNAKMHDEEAAYATDREKELHGGSRRSKPSAWHGAADEPSIDELLWDPTEELLEPRPERAPRLLPLFLLPWLQSACALTVLGLLLPQLALVQALFKPGAKLTPGGMMVAASKRSC